MRWMAALLACTTLVSTTGCFSSHKMPVESMTASDSSAFTRRHGRAIAGYTDAGGQHHKFNDQEGLHARFVPGDSLEFSLNRWQGRLASTRDTSWRIPLSEVQALHVVHFDPFKTLGAVIIIPVTLLGLAALSSCPFIYSWDGTQYVLDGDPYGGATMISLERTDWSELEHLVPAHGVYRLMLTNEVDEIQHTNRLDLVLVDHSPDATVVMDRHGIAHAFRHVAPLTAAVDEAGRNLMTWLRETDEVAWYPVPAAWTSTDSMVDTRSHLLLTFAKPAEIERAWLLSHASTGDWGSTAIRTMLGYRGDRLPEFYAAVNGSPLYQSQLHEWNEREELFELFPEMWCGDHWTRLDFIPGAGPVVSESRAIPLDLRQIPGDQVTIRLHPPIGFWRLNSFRLAWDDDVPRVTRVGARSAIDEGGHDVAAALAADDDRYLSYPTRSNFARLEYPAPPVPRGARRTVFAETRGWYEVNVHHSGPPDLAAITRLQIEPGFAVRQLAHDYREFLRTRTFPGVEMDSLASW